MLLTFNFKILKNYYSIAFLIFSINLIKLFKNYFKVRTLFSLLENEELSSKKYFNNIIKTVRSFSKEKMEINLTILIKLLNFL